MIEEFDARKTVTELLSLIKHYGINDIRVKRLMLALASDPNPETARLIIKLIEPWIHYSNSFLSPFTKPAPEAVEGTIKLGFTEQGLPVGFDEMDRHVLILGRTGVGKTTLLLMAFAQITACKLWNAENHPYAWIFTKSVDITELLLLQQNILTVDFDGSVKINLLEPPDTLTFEEWAPIFADIFIQGFRLYDGSKNFLLEHLQNLYRNSANTGYIPSLMDFYHYIKLLRFPLASRTSRYQESILNRLGGLISGNLGKVFNSSKSHIKDISNSHCIFLISSLYSEMQVFVVNMLLAWLFYQKSHKRIDMPEHEHFIGIDDALLLFDISFEKRPDLGMPILHHLLATVRKAGITLIVTAQTPSSLGSSIFSHVGLTAMMSLADGQDIERMTRMIGIREQTQKQFCYTIPERQAVVKMTRYPDPFVLIVPERKNAKKLV